MSVEIVIMLVVLVQVFVVFTIMRLFKSLEATQDGLLVVMGVLRGAKVYAGQELSREQKESNKEKSDS